jgi:hypothetical protein
MTKGLAVKIIVACHMSMIRGNFNVSGEWEQQPVHVESRMIGFHHKVKLHENKIVALQTLLSWSVVCATAPLPIESNC